MIFAPVGAKCSVSLHIALLRSANLKYTECYKHAAPPEQSRWVKLLMPLKRFQCLIAV